MERIVSRLARVGEDGAERFLSLGIGAASTQLMMSKHLLPAPCAFSRKNACGWLLMKENQGEAKSSLDLDA